MRPHAAIADVPRSKPGPSFEGSSSHDGIALLRALVEQANEGFVSPDVIGQLAAAFENYLADAHRGTTLERCLGIGSDLTPTSWWNRERRDQWDAALVELAAFLQAPTLAQRAERVAQRLRRYAIGSRWPRDRRNGGTNCNGLEAALYRAAMLADGHGLSAKSIQRAIERAQVAHAARDFQTSGAVGLSGLSSSNKS